MRPFKYTLFPYMLSDYPLPQLTKVGKDSIVANIFRRLLTRKEHILCQLKQTKPSFAAIAGL